MAEELIVKNVKLDSSFQNDIYSGDEKIQFVDRHPIFKTLMKLEFEEVLRNFSNKQIKRLVDQTNQKNIMD